MNSEMTRGGKREGAGRKRSGLALIRTSFRITPQNLAYLQTVRGSKGKLINELIAEHRLKQDVFLVKPIQSSGEGE